MPEQEQPVATGYEAGRFTARLGRAPVVSLAAGDYPAHGASLRPGVLFLPSSYTAERPAPFMLALHGATGSGERMLNRWRAQAEARGVVVLAPDSETRTWDVLIGGYGSDVERIDMALADAFSRVNVDPEHLMIEGFSDGASYALGLGLANGDMFTHVLANSPGFCWPPSTQGSPRFLVTHGTEDKVLPIDMTSRMLAPQLSLAGYDVSYHEFAGGHALTPEIMALSLNWAGIVEARGRD